MAMFFNITCVKVMGIDNKNRYLGTNTFFRDILAVIPH